MSRQRAESLLKTEDKEGCFVVRNSSTKGLYTLSLYSKIPHNQVSECGLYWLKQRLKNLDCIDLDGTDFSKAVSFGYNLI